MTEPRILADDACIDQSGPSSGIATKNHYTLHIPREEKWVNYIATWMDVIITGLVMLTLITHEKFCHNKTFIYNS